MNAEPSPANHQPLAVGQKRACLTQDASRKVFVVIGRLEPFGPHSAAHVSIFDETAGADLPLVTHAPFEAAVLSISCPVVVGPGEISPGFDEGYSEWKSDYGGIFSITVEHALDLIADTRAHGQPVTDR